MPLIKGKSKKSLEKNIETEMEAHPEKSKRAQNLAIAYSVQRKAKGQKMAQGGKIEMEPKDHGDELMERDDEKHLLKSASPASPKEHPKKAYDELGADRQGPKTQALGRYSKGGMIDMEPKDHGDELMERDDESHLLSSAKPGSPGSQPKKAYDELDADRHDLGGASNDKDEHYDSIADHILGKMKMMAEGGMVDIEENEEEALEHNSPGWDAPRFGEHMEDEHQPMDSNEHGDHIDSDEHDKDMISSILRRMKSKKGY